MPTPSIPTLGSRGEGWVVAQFALFAAIVAAPLAGSQWDSRPVGAGAGGAVLLAGLLLAVWAGIRLGSGLTPLPRPRDGQTLAASGPYRFARHPMYGGVLLAALGWSLLMATVLGLALTALLAVVLDLKSRREEVWLAEAVEGYGAYRIRTRRRLVPFVY